MSEHTIDSIRRAILLVLAPLLWAAALPAQNSSFVVVTPAKVTTLIGDSASFRLVDQEGHEQHAVVWTVSDSTSLEHSQGDDFTITAKHAGHFFIRALSASGSAEATAEVLEGATLPLGTIKWSGAQIEGCTGIKIIQAVPVANGPDLFEQSQCHDGTYVAAYTSDGIQLWRRKIGSNDAPSAAGLNKTSNGTSPMDVAAASLCDAVPVGTTQQKLREMLDQRRLVFNAGSPSEQAWVVEERNVECKLWFDSKLVLTRKRKTFLN